MTRMWLGIEIDVIWKNSVKFRKSYVKNGEIQRFLTDFGAF